MFPWTPAIERKTRGKAVPAHLLQERTCKATSRASMLLKAHSSSCKEVEHSWRGRVSTGAVQMLQHLGSWGCPNSVQNVTLCRRQAVVAGWCKVRSRDPFPRGAQLLPGSGPFTWHAIQPGVWPSN